VFDFEDALLILISLN